MTDHFNWIPVCTNHEHLRNVGELCNPYSNDQQNNNSVNGTGSLSITRCVGCSLGSQCSARGQLPTTSDVNTVNCKTYYDDDNYDKDPANCGFRNALEGHCEFNDEPIENCLDFSEMHNKVHVYIGGLMRDVPTSSNDPIFWLHHCNVDRLYEKWFENPMVNEENFWGYQPTPDPSMNSVEYKVKFGHNGFDNAGLMFPRITNVDAHRPASELGYSYQQPISCTIVATSSLTSCPTATISPTPTGTVSSTTSNPGDSNQIPGGNNQTPGGNDQTPGGNDQTPGGNNQTPGGNDQTPGGNDQTPGGNDQTPGGNNQNPGGNNRNPGGNNQNSSGAKGSLHPSYMVNTP